MTFNKLLLSLTLTSLCTPIAFAKQSVKHISTYKAPEPIERINPKYPINAAREQREGWTKMSFVVEKDGSVSNAVVIESSGSSDFDKQSLKAVKQWQYSPAIENGQPIQQCINTVKMDFKMSRDGENGVRRRFRTIYLKAAKALEIKDYKEVEDNLEKLHKLKNMHLSESNLYHNLAAIYAKEITNEDLEIHHLNLISTNHSSISPESSYQILARKFFIQIKKNQFSRAITTYNKIKELAVAKPYLASFDDIIAKIDDIINNNDNIVVQANISDKKVWYYPLVRNEFSITNIKGELNKLDVRCANKHHVYTVEDNHTWTIPSSWEHCSLMVFGNENSSFHLIEHPIKS
ncbi:energy transducer TonB [Thalassotalea profundi]|uniref:TonB C-terminal domain-containing protein n=1 Tax=Thalassotalea profundi TaxID=2036687 RepID=A0ABQ3IKD6_9GAMM|nr:energy transducer TonB [Thalassotalea profundi]GHE83826.1 hypothetical protein GCM10011501_10590 [Thalassotalea profundi]